MDPIKHISWPKSGCQVVIWFLCKYFSKHLAYPCETKDLDGYQDFKKKRISSNEVLFGSKVPINFCPAGPMLYSPISRDSKLEELKFLYLHGHEDKKIDKDFKYIIQYRHPIPSLMSIQAFTEKELYLGYDYVVDRLCKWVTWMDKWYDSFSVLENIPHFFISFENFIKNPKKTLVNLIKFIGFDTVDEAWIDQVLEYMDIHPHNCAVLDTYSTYNKYHDYFVKAESEISDHLDRYQIPKIYS